MHDIDELRRRITAALDRIGSGLDRVGTAPPGDGAAEIEAALQGERRTTAELQERLTMLEEGHRRELDEAKRALHQARALLSEVEDDRNRLKVANEALGEAARTLRDANAQGVADADLVNNAALVEIDALKSMRASDRAELDALLALISPVVDRQEETSDA